MHSKQNSTRSSMVGCAVLTAFLGCGVAPVEPDTVSQQSALAATNAQATQANTVDTMPAVADSCACTKTYHLSPDVHTTTCDGAMAQCSPLEHVEECRGESSADCDYLMKCTCECQHPPQQIFDHDATDGVYLTGIPELWQFDYGCSGFKSSFAVGCGPVALATMFYWWAERGYARLVEDHLSGGLQDWKSLVRELRDDYANGGLCLSGQYATTQDRLLDALTSYPADHGIDAYADHYRVCGSCGANGFNDLTTSQGLDIIKEELEGGRPLILGLNAGKMDDSYVYLDGEPIYTGELSVGVGWIDHYAVITGYNHTSDGRDVIYLNAGWPDTDADLAVEWNPGGKWTHLFTLWIPGKPAGQPFCPLDAALSDVFSSTSDVEVSHDTKFTAGPTRKFTPLAGTACGVARDGNHETFIGRWTEYNECMLRDPDLQGQVTDTAASSTIRGGYDDPLIKDHLDPGPF